MTLSLKHAFNSLKSDGVDVSFVQPSYWNAEHTITAAAFTVLGRGSGAGAVTDLPQEDIGVPLGTALAFTGASGSVPSKYLLAFGQAISRATYVDYFTLVGTTYGVGDGSTTFNAPDLRGRAIFGKGDMGGSESSRLNTAIASTLGAVGGGQTESASCTVSGTVTVGGSTSGSLTVSLGTSVGDNQTAAAGVSSGVLSGIGHSHAGSASGTLTVTANGGTTLNGSTATANNVPPGMALNVMVKVLK